MVDLGDARSFQKRSLNMPKQLKIRINTCDGRRIFFFSVLASSSFSLYVRAVREHGPGPGRRLRGLCWTPRSKALPVCRGLGPAGGASGRTGREARGQEGGSSLASGSFPRVLPEDLVESTSQEDLSPFPGRLPPSLWPVRLTECPIPSCSPTLPD